jgi:hypothetical protein
MASILRVNTLTDASSNNSIATSFVANGSAKLHARYTTVTTTATVGSPLNTSTLTDNGDCDTSISITSNMNDANYTILSSGTSNYNSGGNQAYGPYSIGSWTNSSSNQTSSSTRIGCRFASSSTALNVDVDIVSVALLGDLA